MPLKHSKQARKTSWLLPVSHQRSRPLLVISNHSLKACSQGLDFNEIQHVINYTMPKEIEDYVHQIGRTGRSGKTGIATTFVNMNVSEETLLDLKYLLMEAKQRYVTHYRKGKES